MRCFVSHLESAIDGTRLPHDKPQTMHADRPLWVRYDLDAVRELADRDVLTDRPPDMWRYRELLPLPSGTGPVTLGEGMSPLLRAPALGTRLGIPDLWIKDESQLPTGSFKSRGMAMAVTMAKHFGLDRLAVPTAGNAGGALAAYGARAGMEVFIFMPRDTPVINQIECALAGAHVYLVNGLIDACGRIVRHGVDAAGWFDCSTLREPYRIEGKKTMGLELAEQLDWTLPNVILYPTGGGTGLIGMFKAFAELRAIGWLQSDGMPRLVAVQSDGCAPIVRAFEAGARFATPWDDARTCASGIRVPAAVGDFMILDAIRATHGCAVAVPESRIIETLRASVALEGTGLCPEAAACVVAADMLRSDGRIAGDDRVVIFNTGASHKYLEVNRFDMPTIEDPSNVDYGMFR